MALNERELLRIVKHDAIYYRGKQYAQQHLAKIEALERVGQVIYVKGIVQGAKPYQTMLVVDGNGMIQDMKCQCSSFHTHPGACKHIVALGFQFQSMEGKLDAYFKENGQAIQSVSQQLLNLEIEIQIHILEQSVNELFDVAVELKYQRLHLKIKERKRDIDWEIEWFIQLYQKGSVEVKGESIELDTFSDSLKTWVSSLFDLHRPIEEGALDATMCRLLNVRGVVKEGVYYPLQLTQPTIYQVRSGTLSEHGEVYVLPYRTKLLLVNHCAYWILDQDMQVIQIMEQLFDQKKWKITKQEEPLFISTIYPFLRAYDYLLEVPKWEKQVTQPSEIGFYFDVSQQEMKLVVKVHYDKWQHDLNDGKQNEQANRFIEQQLHRYLMMQGFKFDHFYRLPILMNVMRMFDEIIPVLKAKGRIFVSKKFEQLYLGENQQAYKINFDITEQHFTFQLDDLTFDPKELIRIFQGIRLKQTYTLLRDGRMINLNNKSLQKLYLMQQLLDESPSELIMTQSLPKYYALFMAHLFDEAQTSDLFKQLVEDTKQPTTTPIPVAIKAKLRHYQEEGFNWLVSLHKVSFGCILADDMGLGKTLQVITFLANLYKEDGGLPSLVVVPTSLIYNWKHEIDLFCPTLDVVVIQGLKKERTQLLNKKAQVYLTTYGQLRNDVEVYQSMNFECIVLDEAQAIKNLTSLTSKVIKKLNKRMGIAMSGTPIENHAFELYSIFEFVLPHYFKNQDQFKRLIQEGDIVPYINPFILRRTKKEVLKDLPDKIESNTYITMTKQQRKIYESFLLHASKEMERLVALGLQTHRLEFLSVLMKLRQAACHPSLVIEDYHGGSGKMEWLEQQLPEMVQEGHKVLIFSQFRSLLTLVGETLNGMNIDYVQIDGRVNARDRIERVQAFNQGKVPVFLISLKAGGTGLNLATADKVIHLDPWWNPAVMMQATDRAHRIGQKNVVQVFHLVSENSIEEQVIKLQEKKRALFTQLIQEGSNPLQALSDKELMDLIKKDTFN